MPYHYSAFGLNIESDLECPHLMAGAAPDSDVVIRLGSTPPELEDAGAQDKYYQTNSNQFLMKIDGVARYLVSDGREIIVEALPEAAERDVQLFLLGSAMGALLHQRGALALHGSAIATERGAALFVGESGAGKSTLVGEFHRRGFPVLADDVCAILESDDGALQVQPALPRLRLWSDAVEKLGGETNQLTRVRTLIDKYNVPLERFAHGPTPVEAVYVLHVSDSGETVEMTALKGFEKVSELTTNTYRLQYLTDMQMAPKHFRQAEALARQARVVRITRPANLYLLNELADAIERDLAE